MKKVVAVVIVIFTLLIVGCLPAKIFVAAASLPSSEVGQGEAVLFRFAVSADGANVPIEKMVFKYTGNGVSISDLSWYDESNGTEVSGATHYDSEGKIFFWPMWPREEKLIIPRGTTKVFSLRGRVSGEGTVLFQITEVAVRKKGEVGGLPSVITSLTVRR